MANMSYCRFENTLSDLKDCYDNITEDDNLSAAETEARKKLLLLCNRIAEECNHEISILIKNRVLEAIR